MDDFYESFDNILEQTGDNGYSFADRLRVEAVLDKYAKIKRILSSINKDEPVGVHMKGVYFDEIMRVIENE